MQLQGKTVVVVGGSSGIGFSTAQLAKAEGAEVIVASHNAERLKAAAARSAPKRSQTDVTNDDSVARLFPPAARSIMSSLPRHSSRPARSRPRRWTMRARRMESKFWGAWRVARSAEFKPGGSLTLVSGFLSIRPRPNAAITSATNGALESLTRALAVDLSPVRVNCVSPGTNRHADPRGNAGSGAARDAGKDGGRFAGPPRRPRRRHCPANPCLHDQQLCYRLRRLSSTAAAC